MATRAPRRGDKKVGNPPTPREGVRYDWASIVAELRQDPGEWVLLPEMQRVPVTLATAVRARKMLALRTTDGQVDAMVRKTTHTTEGRVCDLWLRFAPKEE